MPTYDILLKTFTTRKLNYLFAISKFVCDTRTPIPPLNNNDYRINGESYRTYLEKLTSLTGTSLHSSYIRQLESLEIDKLLFKDKNNNLRFTELGLSVADFFNQLHIFFGESDFFYFLENTKDYFKKKKTKIIFFFVISEIISIASYLDSLWKLKKIIEYSGKERISIFEIGNIKREFESEMPVEGSLLGYLKIDNFKTFIENIALALKELPAYTERRKKLLIRIDSAFQILLGKNYDKKKIADFLSLEKSFSEWGFLQPNLQSNIQPPLGFDEKLSNILKEEIQPTYAFVRERFGNEDLKFCSKILRKNESNRILVSNKIIEILPLLKHIGNVLQVPFTSLKLIEISILIPYIEQQAKPNIYLIPFEKGFFLVTALVPLYRYSSPPIRKLSITYPLNLTIAEHIYYTFKDKTFMDLNNFDVRVIYYLLRSLERIAYGIYFKKLYTKSEEADLIKEWGVGSEHYDTYRVGSEFFKKDTEFNFERINSREDPLYSSENLCILLVPRVKIYYDNYFISCGITIEAKNHIFFQVFESKNSPNPIYSKIIRLVGTSLK